MSDDEIRYLGDVRRLSLGAGDALVLLSNPEPVSTETASRLRSQLEEKFPGHKVLVMEPRLQLGVLSDRPNDIERIEAKLDAVLALLGADDDLVDASTLDGEQVLTRDRPEGTPL